MGPVVIRRIDALPDDLDQLVRTADGESFSFVARLRRDWLAGANRFDLAGEALFEARAGGALVGIGGLNRDPYAGDDEVGRVRHVYVLPAARGSGLGRRLVKAVVDAARETFRVLRLRTTTEAGDRFYRALGFEPTEGEADATHRLSIRPRSRS